MKDKRELIDHALLGIFIFLVVAKIALMIYAFVEYGVVFCAFGGICSY